MVLLTRGRYRQEVILARPWENRFCVLNYGIRDDWAKEDGGGRPIAKSLPGRGSSFCE